MVSAPRTTGPARSRRHRDGLREQADGGDVPGSPDGDRQECHDRSRGHCRGGEGQERAAHAGLAQPAQQLPARAGRRAARPNGWPGHAGEYRQRAQRRHRRDHDDDRESGASGEPHAGWQRHDGRDAGDHAGQARSLATPVSRDQFSNEDPGDHYGEAESEAAQQAHRHDGHQVAVGQQRERGRPEQHAARAERRPAAEPPDEAGCGELGRHSGQHERARRQSGAKAGSARRADVHGVQSGPLIRSNDMTIQWSGLSPGLLIRAVADLLR
jgi:ribonuclease E